MAWQGIEGHDAIVDQFRRSIERGRLASTFLFVGPSGIGKRTFALKLAQSLLCERQTDAMSPCGACPSCQQVDSLTHPDLEVVSKPPDKTVLTVEQFIGDKAHRMQEGLCHRISLKPSRGGRRVAIVDDADLLGIESANCLLKTLEEPPPRSVLILIGTSLQRQLPTIRSRCQVVAFQPLPPSVLERLLIEKGLAKDQESAGPLAVLAEGSLARAAELSAPELWEFRRELRERLGRGNWQGRDLAVMTAAFVEAAGKEAPLRRARLRVAIGFVIDFCEQLMRQLSGAPLRQTADGDPARQQPLAQTWPRDIESLADVIDQSLHALGHIDANANVPTILDAWIDGIVQTYHGSTPLA